LSREEYAFIDEFGREDDRQPLWRPKDAKPEPAASAVFGAPAPRGSCEFVGGFAYEGALGRKCTLGSVCFLFADPNAYASCPSRNQELRELGQTRKKSY